MAETNTETDRAARSFHAHDLDSLLKVKELLAVLKSAAFEGEVVILDETGSYTVAQLWYNAETGDWMIDMSKYGEA